MPRRRGGPNAFGVHVVLYVQTYSSHIENLRLNTSISLFGKRGVFAPIESLPCQREGDRGTRWRDSPLPLSLPCQREWGQRFAWWRDSPPLSLPCQREGDRGARWRDSQSKVPVQSYSYQSKHQRIFMFGRFVLSVTACGNPPSNSIR